MIHGRAHADWERLIEAGVGFLRERARLGRTTSYTEMNTTLARRTGLREFDFTQQVDRAAMGYLLGQIVERTYSNTGAMLSAIVIYIDANDAGSGFYALAQQMGILPARASKSEKEMFWVEQMNAVFREGGGD